MPAPTAVEKASGDLSEALLPLLLLLLLPPLTDAKLLPLLSAACAREI